MSTNLGFGEPPSDVSSDFDLYDQGLDTAFDQLPTAGVELIKQFTHCCLQARYRLVIASKAPVDNPSSHQESLKSQGPDNQTSIQKIPCIAGWGSPCDKDGSPFSVGDRITQAQANELLYWQLMQETLPLLRNLPRWDELNSNQQGALLSFAHSLNNDCSVLSAQSLLGIALRHRRWYQIPAILAGYYGPSPTAHIELRRQEEAKLFQAEIRRDSYTVINRSRLLSLCQPALTGQDVRRLQQQLVRRGYEIEVDGVFGPLTEWAVEKYQAAVELPITGVADLETQRVIYARDLFMSAPYLIGSDVREVQSLLVRIGYAVTVNGVFNPRTLRAVISFQQYFEMPENGIVEGKTLAKLLFLPAMVSVS
ncbi:MAG: peptidoglycan-binding protein [Cyanobacteria bacterium J06559_1]